MHAPESPSSPALLTRPIILDEILLHTHHRQRIQQATSLDELADAVRQHPQWVRSLIDKGVKVRYIGRAVRELDRQVFRQITSLLATPELLEHICILVMGSEGRGEQVVKTDQDNALIADDTYPAEALQVFRLAFTAALTRLGYPPCPGDVMLCNPVWGCGLEALQNRMLSWMNNPTPTHLMQLAICYDARVVAGQQRLFDRARAFFWEHLPDNPAFYAHLARPVLAFKTPLGWFNRLLVEKGTRQGQIELKKGGIFPIVHGVRTLALEQRLKDPNTVRRINGLMRKGVLERALGADLTEVFEFMTTLRVRARVENQARQGSGDDYLLLETLGRLERESLRECFIVVDQFKSLITHHFRLRMLQ
ncbi:MAG: hypothetical protein HQM02_09590 [Magnetococcales bacterium]|nr:hypothetical protein [Magnetococcales bacterium]